MVTLAMLSRDRLRRIVASFALATLAAAPGCAATVDDDAEEGADAVTVAQAELEPMARKARALADSLSKPGLREGAPVPIPLDGELPSSAFGSWKVAAVVDATTGLQGFMLLPQDKAPAGSFGVMLVDATAKVVGLSAYVPDAAPNAAQIAAGILGALPSDASTRAGSAGGVAPKAIIPTRLIQEGIEIAVRMLTGLDRGKATSKLVGRTEAHLATKVQASTWKAFAETLGDPKLVAKHLASLATQRLAFGSRKVVLVETATVRDLATAADGPKVWTALTRQFGAQRAKVGLAVADSHGNEAVIGWALRNDVPIVVSSIDKRTAREVLEHLSDLSVHAETRAAARAALANPEKASLVRVIENPGLGMQHIEQQAFVPLWAMADDAFGILPAPAGVATSPLFAWFRYFEFSAIASV